MCCAEHCPALLGASLCLPVTLQLSHLFCSAVFQPWKDDDCVLTLLCCSRALTMQWKSGTLIPGRDRWCLPCRAQCVSEPARAFPEHSEEILGPSAGSSWGGSAALPCWSCATRSSCPSSCPALSSASHTWGHLCPLGPSGHPGQEGKAWSQGLVSAGISFSGPYSPAWGYLSFCILTEAQYQIRKALFSFMQYYMSIWTRRELEILWSCEPRYSHATEQQERTAGIAIYLLCTKCFALLPVS